MSVFLQSCRMSDNDQEYFICPTNNVVGNNSLHQREAPRARSSYEWPKWNVTRRWHDYYNTTFFDRETLSFAKEFHFKKVKIKDPIDILSNNDQLPFYWKDILTNSTQFPKRSRDHYSRLKSTSNFSISLVCSKKLVRIREKIRWIDVEIFLSVWWTKNWFFLLEMSWNVK